MVAVKLVIQSVEDAKNGKPLLEGVTQENLHECEEFSIGILEKGTIGGQTTLMFICKDGDKAVVGQMTANQFEMLIGAVRGAIQRFGK